MFVRTRLFLLRFTFYAFTRKTWKILRVLSGLLSILALVLSTVVFYIPFPDSNSTRVSKRRIDGDGEVERACTYVLYVDMNIQIESC